MALYLNIIEAAISNKNYRNVIYTGNYLQVVLMSLEPGEEIGMEIHPYADQFIRVEEGEGLAIVDGVDYELFPGVAMVIPARSRHNVINTGMESLNINTIYAPPQHPRLLVQTFKNT